MFTPKNHDSLLVFILGVIILVIGGIALTMWLEGMNPHQAMESELVKQSEQIAALKVGSASWEGRLKELEVKAERQRAKLQDVRARAQAMREHLRLVRVERQELAAAVVETKAAYDEYRMMVGERNRSRAIGRHLGDLVTTSGRVYRHAVIRRVTADGLEISYESGIAVLSASDLPPAFSDHYHWSGIDTGGIEVAAAGTPPLPKEVNQKTVDFPDSQKQGQIGEARQRLSIVGVRWLKLEAELETLEQQSQVSKSRSVAGSLDTWHERIMAVRAKVTTARAAYRVAKAELMQLSPRDPVLAVWQGYD